MEQPNDNKLKEAENRNDDKEKILSAVAMSIKELLFNRNYLEATAKSFQLIGDATNVDRVYLFQNTYDENGRGRTSQKIEWNSGGSEPQIDNPQLQDVPFEDIESFVEMVIKNNKFYGVVKNFNDDRVRELLEAQGILSIIILPIFVNETFWGFIGFDECKYERSWTEAEFSTLSAFANSLERAIERQKIEEELELSKKAAEAANVAKSQFLANMSHEIRTPLNGVLGTIDLLSKTELSEQQLEYITLLKRSTNSLVTLINDVLDLSKIEAGRLELSNAPFDFNQGIKDIVTSMEVGANEKGLRLSYEISRDIPANLCGDYGKIRQILFNLLSNSIKFTEKGSIEVKALNDFNLKDDYIIKFIVKDSGIGISEENLRSIFEPFTQADSSITRKFGGTGLGLAICERLVELMGGKIEILSKEGVGTEVHFRVPLSKVKNKESSTQKISSQILRLKEKESINRKALKRKNLNVLMVEDNDVNQMLVCKIMETEGHNCTIATNGVEAIKIFDEHEFDLVLMDVQMPEMDGFEATSLIRKTKKGKDVPIVAVTAHAMNGYKDKCIEAGMDYYLSKPFYSSELTALIEDIINNSKAEAGETSEGEYNGVGVIFEKMKSDLGFFKKIANKFESDSKTFIQKIGEAIEGEDGEKLRSEAHSLKGAISIFDEKKAFELARSLEMMGKEGKYDNAFEKLGDLQRELETMFENIKSFIKEKSEL